MVKNSSSLYGSLPRWRLAVQLCALALCLFIGWQFAAFYREAVAGGPLLAQRPSGVEAFLPISALLGLRVFLATGEWDAAHPAGLTFFIALLVSAILFRRVFCSWVCPVGTASRLLEWVNRRIKLFARLKSPPKWAGRLLLAPKYLLLAAVLWVFGSMPIPAVRDFLASPYNMAVDANMLRMFAGLTLKGWLILGGLAALSLIVANGWCRFLCPYGALLSLAGLASFLRVGRSEDKCTGCRKCTRACGVGIAVHESGEVRSPECTLCQSCVAACPEAGALKIKVFGRRALPLWVAPVGGVGVLLLAYVIAVATGHWDSALTPEQFRYFYMIGLR